MLLEEGSNKSKVKMHDVVREMALWISSDLGENREKCNVRASVGLCEVPKVEKWNVVEKMCFGLVSTDPLSFRSHFLP